MSYVGANLAFAFLPMIFTKLLFSGVDKGEYKEAVSHATEMNNHPVSKLSRVEPSPSLKRRGAINKNYSKN